MTEKLDRIVFKNTMANYVLMAGTFVSGVVATRILFLGLGPTAYGFWTVLWAVFGYSLLLDFGFGTSVQKYASEYGVTGDLDRFNRLLSTVMTTYGMMSVIIIAAAVGLSAVLDTIFKFPAGTDIVFYKRVFLLFGVGTALTFPMGAFAEILRGMKKIYLRNIVQMAALALNLAGIIVIFRRGGGLVALALYSIGLQLLANVAMALMVRRLVPGLRPRFRDFDKGLLREVFRFSVFAYIIMFSNMVIYKTDEIVLGAMLGMGAVAVYQVGSRLADVLLRFTTQFQDNLAPIAAALVKSGELDRLRRILLDSNKLIALSSNGLFWTFTLLAEPILLLWLKVTDPTAVQVAIIMNVAMFLLVIFRSGSSKVLLMAGSHKFLSRIGLAESVLNIGLSIVFIKLWGVVGVALGTLVPNLFLSAFFVFPRAAAFSGITIRDYVRRIYLPVLLVSLPSIALLQTAIWKIPLHSWTIWTLAGVAGASGLLYAVLGFFFVLNRQDRARLKRLLPGMS